MNVRPVRLVSQFLPRSLFQRDVAVLGGGAVLNAALLAITVPFIGRLYGPSAFGYWALLQSVAAIVATVGGLRYELAVVVACDQEEATSVAAVQVLCNFATALLAFLIVVIFRDKVARGMGSPELSPWLFMVPVISFFTAMSLLVTNWLIRAKQFRQLARIALVQSGVTAIAQVGAGFLMHRRTEGLVLGGILGQLVPLVAMAGPIGTQYQHLSRALSPRRLWRAALTHARFPKYVMPGSLVAALRDRGIIILLATLATPRVVGFYAMALRLLWAPQGMATNSLNCVLFQRATEEENISNLSPLVSQVLTRIVRLAGPPFVFLIWWSPDLFALGLGEQWRGAGVYAAILSVPAFAMLLQSWMDRLLIVVKGQRTGFIIESVYSVLALTTLSASLAAWRDVPISLGIFSLLTGAYHVSFLVTYYRLCHFPYADLRRLTLRVLCIGLGTTLLIGSTILTLRRDLALYVDAATILAYCFFTSLPHNIGMWKRFVSKVPVS